MIYTGGCNPFHIVTLWHITIEFRQYQPIVENVNMAIIKEDNGDARADASTQYTIIPGDVFQGTLDPAGDNDWIRVELNAGTNYDVRITGIPTVQLDIQNSEGYRGSSGYYQASAEKFIFSMTYNGIFYIRIGSSNFDFTGDYELSIVENTPSIATHEEIAGYESSKAIIFDPETKGVITANITVLDEANQQLAHWALEAWAMVANFEFQIVDHEEADITFRHSSQNTGAFAFIVGSSGGFITSAYVHVPAEYATIFGGTTGSYTFAIYLHEIGHALGLDHPGPYGGSANAPDERIFLNDTTHSSVLSYYTSSISDGMGISFADPVTPMMADIIAIQNLYGAPAEVNSGDSIYGYQSNLGGYLDVFFEQWLSKPDYYSGRSYTLVIYDTGGTDTLDLRTDVRDQRVDLNPGKASDVFRLLNNLVIERNTLIENYIAGTGDDHVVGNMAANRLEGRGGSDHLQGNGGNDVLEGGAGADRLEGGVGMDWISYQESDSAVTINLARRTLTGGHAEGDIISEIENVIGSGYGDVLEGDSSANWFDGGPGNDEISGNDGNDVLEGGVGADTLTGGGGADTASYAQSGARVVVRLHSREARGGDAEGDTFAVLVMVDYIDSEGETQQETVPDIENLLGSAHADSLAGDSRANRLAGGAGDDALYGGPGGGDDMLAGGPGTDALYGGIGDDVLEGGAGADTLRGGPGADTASYEQSAAGVEVRLHSGVVRGGDAEGDVLDGIENLTGSAHADILEGDAGANRLDGGGGVDWLSYASSAAGVTVKLRDGTGAGGHAEGDVIAGFENIRGSDYNDVFGGDSNNNHLVGGDGSDGLWGSSGDDMLEGGPGADRMFGSIGEDWVIYRDSDMGVTVDLKDGAGAGGHAEGDTIAEVENVEGSGFDDFLEGNDDPNRLDGAKGDDEIRGNGGDDILHGGVGADRLDGGMGIDTVFYRDSNEAVTVKLSDGTANGGHAESDVIVNVESIIGSAYNDTLVGDDMRNRLSGDDGDDMLEGGGGADLLDGGTGMDSIVYWNSNEAVSVNLSNGIMTGGHAAGDVIINVENVEGSDFDDKLIGDSGANRLEGGTGNDVLQGGNGNDELIGNEGDDMLEGDEGIDLLDGGPGVDTVSFPSAKKGLHVNLQANKRYEFDYMDKNETIINIENVIGSGFSDLIAGDDNANELYGREGNDRLYGEAGDDNLYGEAGDDLLMGSFGADLLDGGPGTDTVTYSSSREGVTVNLGEGIIERGEADGDVFVSIENVEGSIYDDVLEGDNGANRISGGSGNDLLKGGEGADQFVFGEFVYQYMFADVDDNDIILDFTDNEDLIDLTFYGLSGFDKLTISSDPNAVIIDLSDHGGGTILLEDFNIANLDSSDFIF